MAKIMKIKDSADRIEYLNPERIVKAFPTGDGRIIVKSDLGGKEELTYTTEVEWERFMERMEG